ncbi:protein TESPA1-like isoform X3 [Oncorhynchus keta]|uniref:protein TESPA1-like isoform X3 n=1 Tax=Oncorhynchus keta TaxID=8018 RepID=UPI0015F95742|nr:protein TESPA1-like isoform X3 [Oncorhynchus keta]
MESPSSTTRRQAWVQTSRQWLTLELDPQVPGPYIHPSAHPSTLQRPGYTHPSAPHGPPYTHPSDQHQSAEDDVFSDGCSAGNIESWLLGCGLETGSENSSNNLTVESLLKANSFEDDLSLGAEATALNVKGVSELRVLLPPPKHLHRGGVTTSTPRQRLALPLLHLGYSIASSGFSNSTSKASRTSLSPSISPSPPLTYTHTPVCLRCCNCVQRMQRRLCTIWGSDVTSLMLQTASPPVSSTSLPSFTVSTSASSSSPNCTASDRRTQDSLWPVVSGR